jgi:hypothetical protein
VAMVVGTFTLAHLENGVFKLLIFVFSKVFRRKRLLKVEMQFFSFAATAWCYFFSALAKKVREEMRLIRP